MAFEIAARMCMREGMRKAGAKLLEPIMKVEVITPEEHTGGIIGDPDIASRSGSRSGQIAAMRDCDRCHGTTGEYVWLHQYICAP